MKTPSCSSRITKEWVKFVVEEHLKKQRSQPIPKADIKDFSIGQGAKIGDAFNSELVTLDVSASLTEGEDPEAVPISVKYQFFVKFLSTDIFNREINMRFQSNLKEYSIYAEIIKDLNKLQSSFCDDDFQIHVPELIYGKHKDKEFVLVMENLKSDGYENNDKYKGLDFPHLKEAVIQLARLHALSYVHDKKQPFLEKHPYFKFNAEAVRIFASFFVILLENVLALLDSKKDKGDLIKKIEACKERFIESFFQALQPNLDIPSCITHGDYWNNNIMYKYDSDERESREQNETKLHCKIVDWGNSGWGSPVIDLQYLMHTSTTLETRKEHLEALLQYYHSTFTEITTKAGTPVPNWTYDDMTKEWQRLSMYGFVMGSCLSQGTLCKTNIMNKPSGPSVLDSSFCLPTKFLVDGMKQAMAKVLIGFMFRPSGAKLTTTLYRKMFGPVKEEILSGSNEVMNKRLMDLVLEADEKGLFDG